MGKMINKSVSLDGILVNTLALGNMSLIAFEGGQFVSTQSQILGPLNQKWIRGPMGIKDSHFT